jgi:hypothetical protein
VLQWHQGSASPKWTPVGRGFDQSWGFLGGGEDHFTQINGHCAVDGVQFDVTDYWQETRGVPGHPIWDCGVPPADRRPCPLFQVLSKNQSAAAATAACESGLLAGCHFAQGTEQGPESTAVPAVSTN